jgi:hypothetical protein
MQEKYGKEKFAAVSVSLDDPKENGTEEKVLKFLKEKKANFANVILNEKPEVWQKKLGFDGPPCVFVFNREGKWKKFESPVEYADVEKYVAELMK